MSKSVENNEDTTSSRVRLKRRRVPRSEFGPDSRRRVDVERDREIRRKIKEDEIKEEKRRIERNEIHKKKKLEIARNGNKDKTKRESEIKWASGSRNVIGLLLLGIILYAFYLYNAAERYNELVCNSKSCQFKHSYCVQEAQGLSCQCHIGYRPAINGSACIDYDECTTTAPAACSTNATCTNKEGSYDCKCKQGYVDRYGDASLCLDVDECFHQRPCSHNSARVKTEGRLDYRLYKDSN